MSSIHRDQTVVTEFLEERNIDLTKATFDDEGRLLYLDISGLNLQQLPFKIGQLTNLQWLNLNGNQLSQVPSEIGQLSSLQWLYLSGNQLSQVPSEIGQLANLQELYLNDNQLSQVPGEIGQLANLQELSLNGNRLSQVPGKIGQLANLQHLNLNDNQLGQVPSEISQLTNLQWFSLSSNRLSQVPSEISQLTNLQHLNLSGNQLSQVPSEIGQLTNLRHLNLSSNQLSQVPGEIGQLSNLRHLNLSSNQLSQVPSEIGQLANLQELYLNDNQLSQMPFEIGQLANLQELYLSSNQLSQVPGEIGQLANLQHLDLDNNLALVTPPPEIVTQGTQNILKFLRELCQSNITRYESKLLIVGEGGTGKSSLLRALRNDAFDPQLLTTHGIEINELKLQHQNHEITLHTWDFGGQHIYHATHQFFLTKRSLYIVVWNARLGAGQGKLDYWLDTIKTLAPNAPVLLVASHIDERSPDLNYQLYKDAYQQLIGHIGISNLIGTGIAELKQELTKQALKLPLIGQPWPQKWLAVEELLAACPEPHIDTETYLKFCSSCGVEEDIANGTLANYLHDLGKILYFRDEDLLSSLVVLKPNWVTQAIARVLDNEVISRAKGIMRHADLPHIWTRDTEGRPYERYLFPILLRLMERFELSYQLETDFPKERATSSLIPLLLPHEPPIPLPPWPKAPSKDQSQVEMVCRLDIVPAGIMSRVIVRTHRYSKDLHWRDGVMLEYQGHQARVELNPILRELKLLVQGPLPQNFFTILMNTIDVVLARFDGLTIRREIPCICHWNREATQPCQRFYRYEDLVRRMEAGKYSIECPETLLEVSVPQMLYGIHRSTNERVIADIQEGQREIRQQLADLKKLDAIVEKLDQQAELIGRDFTRRWNLEMAKMEAECPNTFIIALGSSSRFNPKNWVSQEYKLILVCQHPPQPHPVEPAYPLRQAEEWWITMSPWLNRLVTFLKFGIPIAGKTLEAVLSEADIKKWQNAITLLEEITQDIPKSAAFESVDRHTATPILHGEQQIVGPALRVLQHYLETVDSQKVWGKLQKTLTPDGHILWLCARHRQQYEVKPLQF